MSKESGTAAGPGGDDVGLAGRWPVCVFVLIVLGATIYAFSPRHPPPFPPTRVSIDNLLVTGLARQGGQLIAVGELGHILYADSAAGPWQRAKIDKARGSTFTKVAFVGKGVALAVGHGAWIVRSTDFGHSWTEVSFDPKLHDALMDVAGPFDGTLFAVGSFGLIEASTDDGKTWATRKFDITPLPQSTAAAPVDPNADPFANYTPPDDPSTHHLYALTQLADGSLLLVGERGLLARSADHGASWTQLPSTYDGSFFGVLKPTRDSVLVFGMRGHAFLSRDAGRTWTRSVMPKQISMFGGTVLADGRVVLVGSQETVMVSADGGAHFAMASQADRGSMDTVIPLGNGRVLAGGVLGAHRVTLDAGHAAAIRGGRP